MMKFGFIVCTVLAGLSLSSCAPDSDASHAGSQLSRESDNAAHKAGQAAYQITQEAKVAAKKAEKKLEEASREAKTGWNDAKRKAQSDGSK